MYLRIAPPRPALVGDHPRRRRRRRPLRTRRSPSLDDTGRPAYLRVSRIEWLFCGAAFRQTRNTLARPKRQQRRQRSQRDGRRRSNRWNDTARGRDRRRSHSGYIVL